MTSIEVSGAPELVDVSMPDPPSPVLSGSPEFGHALALENGDAASVTGSQGSPISPASSFELLPEDEDDPNHKLPEPDEEPQFRGKRNEAVVHKPLPLAVQQEGVVVVEPPVLPEHEVGDAINPPGVAPGAAIDLE